MRLASLIVVDSGGKMSSLFEVTSGKLSGDRTQRRVWMEAIFTVQTFFQLASLGWVKRMRPSKGNRVSSEFQPSISKAICRDQKYKIKVRLSLFFWKYCVINYGNIFVTAEAKTWKFSRKKTSLDYFSVLVKLANFRRCYCIIYKKVATQLFQGQSLVIYHWQFTFRSLMELRSSESDFLLGLLFPEEDIIGCRRFQSFDEFTTSLASCKAWIMLSMMYF